MKLQVADRIAEGGNKKRLGQAEDEEDVGTCLFITTFPADDPTITLTVRKVLCLP